MPTPYRVFVVVLFGFGLFLLSRESRSLNRPSGWTSLSTKTSFHGTDTAVYKNNTTVFWWENYLDGLPRIFLPSDKDWCDDDKGTATRLANDSNDSSILQAENGGIMFVKSPKAASSTGAGITLRLAHNTATRRNRTCPRYYHHDFAESRRYTSRNRSKSLLWTIVRDPVARAISDYFYYKVGWDHERPSDSNMLWHMQHIRSKQVQYLLPYERHPRSWDSMTGDQIQAAVHDILDEYDFIGVAERLDESLVVLHLLFGLDLRDLVVIPAKLAGSFSYALRGRCQAIPKHYTTPVVEDYLEGEFVDGNADFLLYEAVVRSLDHTVDHLGRHVVRARSQELNSMQQLVNSKCASQAAFPCSRNGTKQLDKAAESCYDRDFGCGYKCVDQVLGV